MVAQSRNSSHGWHFILADLALILFLLTLASLPLGAEAVSVRGRSTGKAEAEPDVAPAQALYRPVAGGPGLAEWLAGQPRDPRATLTIFARYPAGGQQAAWQAAQALAREADGDRAGVQVRTIIAPGSQVDLYASLAYDAALPAAP
ncbi:MAG: hypothetical protein MUF47_05390 [Porphyrobacter sp.]|jgi:hypothetical protein|nr:hypothetical protein [Porphyrobacter sp.]